ncbi:GNAT family N-acetyltransferase [Sporosalibacterium faouarense]|uniref:GNAT family N-acetyltransferase n=1 Tax=Sporosalibacterium faouarense TaxID=516123 RepID=UPI00192BB3DE|nr:GNAT family N-acetyltransferase [Sporosalibacterium faouarense]
MDKTTDRRVIENILQNDKIATLNAAKMMENEENWEILVDDISNPKGFILRCGEWNIPYSLNDKIALKMLNSMEFRKTEGFSGVLKKYYDMIKESKKIEWEEPCYLFYMNKEDLDTSKLQHEVKSLRLEDVEIVNEFYTYKDEESFEYIKQCIIQRETSAIFDDKGNPISWALVREDGTMGIMYTKKEYRGRGLAASVSIDLAKKVINNNGTPFVHIVTNNDASISLAKSIGFKKYCEVMWFGVSK